jgi:hypothetical protein
MDAAEMQKQASIGRLAGKLRKLLYGEVAPLSQVGRAVGQAASYKALPTPLRQPRRLFDLLADRISIAGGSPAEAATGRAVTTIPGLITEADTVRRTMKAARKLSNRRQLAATKRVLKLQGASKALETGDSIGTQAFSAMAAPKDPAEMLQRLLLASGKDLGVGLAHMGIGQAASKASRQERLLGGRGQKQLKKLLLGGKAGQVDIRPSPRSLLQLLTGQEKGSAAFSLGNTAYVPSRPKPDFGKGDPFHGLLRALERKSQRKPVRDALATVGESPITPTLLNLASAAIPQARHASTALSLANIPLANPLKALQ